MATKNDTIAEAAEATQKPAFDIQSIMNYSRPTGQLLKALAHAEVEPDFGEMDLFVKQAVIAQISALEADKAAAVNQYNQFVDMGVDPSMLAFLGGKGKTGGALGGMNPAMFALMGNKSGGAGGMNPMLMASLMGGQGAGGMNPMLMMSLMGQGGLGNMFGGKAKTAGI